MSFLPSLINPFSTAVGEKIEQATDAAQATENWAMYMEICDMINESSDNARDAMKAIRKRLSQSADKKNYTVAMYTLVLLETCVKNCGRPFHTLVASKDFTQDLVKMISPKNEPPAVVQDKVLGLIQVWAQTFQSQPELSGVVQSYQELKNKGIEFPAPELESVVPIYTPQRSVPATVPSNPTPVTPAAAVAATQAPHHHQAQPQSQMVGGGVLQQMGAAGPYTLAGDQLAKLQSELDIVTVNSTILSDMLSQLVPGQEAEGDYQMLTVLTETCKEMQGRIVELIGKVTNDEITAELLRINDELNNLFLRHARYEKNRNPQTAVTGGGGGGAAGTGASPSAILGSAMGIPAPAAESSLIDLGGSESNRTATDLATKLSGLDLKPTNVSKLESVPGKIGTTTGSSKNIDEFDLLAQSRTTDGSSTLKKDSDIMAKETEFDEMAAWLKNNSEEGAAGAEDSLTSTEFDRFLAERAAAADNLPTISKEEKHRMAEVNDEPPVVVGASSSVASGLRQRRVQGTAATEQEEEKKKKAAKQEESLIEF